MVMIIGQCYKNYNVVPTMSDRAKKGCCGAASADTYRAMYDIVILQYGPQVARKKEIELIRKSNQT